MLELISLLGGGLMRLFPTLFDFLKQKQDLKHELSLLDKQVEIERIRGVNRVAEIDGMTSQTLDTKWADGLVEALKSESDGRYKSGIAALDWLSASVRPILTYWWCIVLYTTSKLCTIYAGFDAEMDTMQFAKLIMTDFDQIVVGSIIGFWFVDRALRAGNQK